MEKDSVLAEYLQEVQDDPEFWTEHVLLELRTALLCRMKDRNVRRSELAEKMGKQRSYISKLLTGHHNSTLRTLVEACVALDCLPRFALQELASCKKGFSLQWVEVAPAQILSIPCPEPDPAGVETTYAVSQQTSTTLSASQKNTILFPARTSKISPAA